MYNDVKYKKNYLKEVVLRVDFLSELEKNNNNLKSKLNKAILNKFNIPEIKESVINNVKINIIQNKAIPSIKSEKVKEFHYFDKDRTKELVITKEFMYISYKKYDVFENFKSDFIQILNELFQSEGEFQVKRIGLRYINSIDLPNDDPLNWDNYINPSLISCFNFYREKEHIARLFNLLELNLTDFNVRYQYGMHNPDFPAPIYQKIFVLDFDAYYDGVVDRISDIERYIDKFHDNIQYLFETSISDGLRCIMNE